jgi:two-component system cell cycle sensor histidine kinase/response regulator CckA
MSHRVLIVDDDPEMRALVSGILDGAFEVSAASGAEEALTLIDRISGLSLLLTDIRMPGMDGFELAKRARARNPDLRVLFMSGYAAEHRIDPLRDDFVGKPFLPRELLGCVFEILARPRRRDRPWSEPGKTP